MIPYIRRIGITPGNGTAIPEPGITSLAEPSPAGTFLAGLPSLSLPPQGFSSLSLFSGAFLAELPPLGFSSLRLFSGAFLAGLPPLRLFSLFITLRHGVRGGTELLFVISLPFTKIRVIRGPLIPELSNEVSD